MSFTGIPTAALDFYEDLEDDNSKVFWAAHRSTYEESVRAPMEALAADLTAEFGAAKLFRPYRDVRFAKDKTPYKTQQGIWFAETSRYVHVSAAGLFVAGGYWATSPAQVDRLRRAIDDDRAGPELERAVAAVTADGFELGGHQLTRVPSGFDREHPRADLLRHRTLVATRDFRAPAWLRTRRAQTEITSAFRRLQPLTAWLHKHVGTD